MSLQILPTEQSWSLLSSDEIIDSLVKAYSGVEITNFYHNHEKHWPTMTILSTDHRQQFLRESIKTTGKINPPPQSALRDICTTPNASSTTSWATRPRPAPWINLPQVCYQGPFPQQPSAATVVAHTLRSTAIASPRLNIELHSSKKSLLLNTPSPNPLLSANSCKGVTQTSYANIVASSSNSPAPTHLKTMPPNHTLLGNSPPQHRKPLIPNFDTRLLHHSQRSSTTKPTTHRLLRGLSRNRVTSC